MEYKKDLFETENIPDYALQPAKPADEFDPSVYDKLFAAMTQQKAPLSEAEQMPAAGPDVELVSAQIPYNEAAYEVVPEAEPVSLQDTGAVQVSAQEYEEAPVSQPLQENEAVQVSEEECEEVPVSQPLQENEAVQVSSQEINESFEEAAPVMVPKASPIKIMPAGKNQVSRNINYTDFRKLSPITIHVEEDILVPDVKPDLESILCVDAKCRLAERSISTGVSGIQAMRISGDLSLHTVYIADKGDNCEAVECIESKLHFREDCPIKTSPNGNLILTAYLDCVDHEKINERKFRIKADISVCAREYRPKEAKLFNSIEGEEVQSLYDKVNFTDVALCKTESIEICEELKLKEGMPEIDKILCYNVNVVENHKQISREKAVINAAVYCNVMYQSESTPVLYQGKTEFTQFIKMDDESAFSKPFTGSRATFNITDLSIVPKSNESGQCCQFELNMDVDTVLEYYREIEEPVITDLYHYDKDVRYDTDTVVFMNLCGNGVSDATVREIINIPDRYSTGFQVVYLSGSPIIRREQVEMGKCVVEGVIPLYLVCLSGEEEKKPFYLKQDLNFRSSMEIPGCRPDMEVDSQAVLKELWYDQINSRQIEVNAGIGITANVFGKSSRELIQTVSFLESEESAKPKSKLIVYVAKDGDDVWKIAKKYRISMNQIKEINGIENDGAVLAGTKLLIIR